MSHDVVIKNKTKYGKWVGYNMMAGVAYHINRMATDHLTTEKVQNLYLVDGYLVEKYHFLKGFREVSEYKESYLGTFTVSDQQLFIIKNHSLMCYMLSLIKSADWNGGEQYKLTIRLCDSIINNDLKECLMQFINENLTKYRNFPSVLIKGI